MVKRSVFKGGFVGNGTTESIASHLLRQQAFYH